ncbi:MAG: hypothetical protein FJ144_17395 [Deltaproteobacteria bacterium]|nr:hypothetical protein [Deltaproteobacteria bacterium]
MGEAKVADVFENRRYDLRKPSRLCLAAGYDGQVASNPDAHLMCYRAIYAADYPPQERVVGRIHTHDVFGEMILDTKSEQDLCVRATVELP